MAGSFRHCDKKGGFRFELIENMGDAQEACEEMHWLIWHLAKGKRKRVEKALNRYYAVSHIKMELKRHGADEKRDRV